MPISVRVKEKADVYDIITQQFIDALDHGSIPWRKTWIDGLPTNLFSGTAYQGINLLLLAIATADRYFVTYRQADLLGGTIVSLR